MKFNLNDLREALNQKIEKVQALADIEASEGQLNEDQLSNFDTLIAEIAEDKAKLKRAETAQALAAGKATPVGIQSGPAIHTKPELQEYKGAKFARLAMSVAAGKGNLSDAAYFAEHEIGDKDVAMAVTTAADSGGSLVPENFADELIEMLTPKNVVRKLGARVIDLPNGNLTMPRQTGGAQSHYKGETQKGKVSKSKFGSLKMTAKEQITLVPISNRLIGRSGYRTEQLVLNDMVRATAGAQDKAFLRGDGSNESPIGLRKTALDAGRVISFSGEIIATNIDEYLGALLLALEEADSNMETPGWALAPRTARFLKDLKNASGKNQYPEMDNGFLKGLPYATTNHIPADLGLNGNESEIVLADFNDVLIGETGSWQVDFSTETAYEDEHGNIQFAYQQNMSLLRLVNENDIGFRHLEGLILGDKVTFNSTHYLNQ